MSFLRTTHQASIYPQYTGLQIQTSSGAVPISIVYGINKIAPNIFWSGRFRTVPIYSGSSKGGGKGGLFNTSGGPSSYDYRDDVMLGLCEGPIKTIGTIWNGQALSTLSSLGFTLFPGTTPQATWGYLASAFPAQALSYNGLAYVCAANFDMGSSAAIDSFWFEVYGVLYTSAVVNAHDADPALVVQDFLTNAQYGVGFPAASIDATSLLGGSGGSSYQAYCQAAGLALSPALTNQEAANSILARWLQITNTAAVWSGGVLKFIPYGDMAITGNLYAGGSVTFNPNVTPLYDLTDDDFIHDNDKDPIEVERSDPYAAYNMQILEISQRSNYYDATPIKAFDQNAIELYGLRIAPTITAHEICDPNVAATAAQLILQRGLYIRNHYTFKLSWEYCLLEPMDLVTLTDTNLGLTKTVVRIIEVEEDDNGLLTVTAEEFPAGTATAAAYPVQTGTSSPVNSAVAPASVNPPIIFEPPPALVGGTPQIWAAVSGGANGVADPNWGGAYVWASLDGASYTAIGSISAPARQGVLTAALPAFTGGNPDTAHTLSVSTAESNGALASTSAAGLQQAVTLSLVDGELIAYQTATLTGTNTYQLTLFMRGLYGSSAKAHAAGAPFARLDDAIFKYDLPQAYIGKTIYLKFQSFNIFGAAPQELSDCTAYIYTPIGSGVLGPVASSLAIGSNLDYSLASLASTETDDFGLASDPFVQTIDMGLASDTPQALSVSSGGTGATTAAGARAAIGAAAAGTNSDITSLTGLAGIGINTTVDPVTNRLSVKSASVLFDNIGNGSQVTVNKHAGGDTGAVLFQTGYSGRASAGLLGGDRYKISVSTDGTTFRQAVDIDPATGHVGLAGYTADSNNGLGVLGTNFLFAASADSCRFGFSKTATTNDASLSFQTNFSARALAGLLGSDSYQLKVSPDGSNFFQVYVADQATGNLAFKGLIGAAAYMVAALPAGFNGAIAFATNGRKLGEAAGAGTGVLVCYSNGAWRRLSDDTIVAA